MRRMAILVVVVGLSAVGASPAAAQLPEAPLPDLPAPLPDLPVPEVPEVESPELTGDDGGGSQLLPLVETPSTGSSGGSGGGGSGGGSSGGGGSGSSEGSGSASCPCATLASGYPAAGDYDNCTVENGAHGAASLDVAGLAASRSDGSSGGGANGAAGGVLGVGAYGGDASQRPGADDGALLGEGGSANSLLAGVLFAFIGLGLLVGIGGGLRAYRQGFP
jgi:hypothetical protein